MGLFPIVIFLCAGVAEPFMPFGAVPVSEALLQWKQQRLTAPEFVVMGIQALLIRNINRP